MGGGSLNEYFDGTTFTANDTVARVMDFGKAFYAAQTYNNDPQGRAIVVGWMSNWYSQLVPTYPWRGVDSLPRILSVLPNQTSTGGLLVQTPISLDSLHDRTLYNGSATLSTNPLVIPTRGNSSFEFETTVSSTPVPNEFQQRLDIDLLNEAGEKVTVGYDWSLGHVFVDRGGARNFENPLFADKFSAWEQNPDNSIELHVFVDRSTIEVFVDHGTQVCSLCFYMLYGPPTKMRWHALNGTVNVQNLQAYTLKKYMEEMIAG
jgi:sucrose-6-phosphate hydrolase SacC (GH32 family)